MADRQLRDRIADLIGAGLDQVDVTAIADKVVREIGPARGSLLISEDEARILRDTSFMAPDVSQHALAQAGFANWDIDRIMEWRQVHVRTAALGREPLPAGLTPQDALRQILDRHLLPPESKDAVHAAIVALDSRLPLDTDDLTHLMQAVDAKANELDPGFEDDADEHELWTELHGRIEAARTRRLARKLTGA